MNRMHWQRIEELFELAHAQPIDARRPFLAEACGADVMLRDEIEAMLAAVGSDHALGIERFIVDRAVEAGNVASVIGSRLGPWRLVGVLGRGGMGVVYRAERADGHYRQEVAVKILGSGPSDPYAIERFRTERQVLAHLTHPNIAGLLDGGFAPDGTPYLVMELVDGVPINEWCAAQRLPLEARLRLFRVVCDAVQHAHRALVVHRDLKPSNIFVSQSGVVKLLDFGIAKLLDPSAWDVGTAATRADLRLITPEYAAPEQRRDGHITTATDVYALGVVLYELLTGQRPCELTREHDVIAPAGSGSTAGDRAQRGRAAIHPQPTGPRAHCRVDCHRRDVERRGPASTVSADSRRPRSHRPQRAARRTRAAVRVGGTAGRGDRAIPDRADRARPARHGWLPGAQVRGAASPGGHGRRRRDVVHRRVRARRDTTSTSTCRAEPRCQNRTRQGGAGGAGSRRLVRDHQSSRPPRWRSDDGSRVPCRGGGSRSCAVARCSRGESEVAGGLRFDPPRTWPVRACTRRSRGRAGRAAAPGWAGSSRTRSSLCTRSGKSCTTPATNRGPENFSRSLSTVIGMSMATSTRRPRERCLPLLLSQHVRISTRPSDCSSKRLPSGGGCWRRITPTWR